MYHFVSKIWPFSSKIFNLRTLTIGEKKYFDFLTVRLIDLFVCLFVWTSVLDITVTTFKVWYWVRHLNQINENNIKMLSQCHKCDYYALDAIRGSNN